MLFPMGRPLQYDANQRLISLGCYSTQFKRIEHKSMLLHTTRYSLSIGRVQCTLCSPHLIIGGLNRDYLQLPTAGEHPRCRTEILSNRKESYVLPLVRRTPLEPSTLDALPSIAYTQSKYVRFIKSRGPLMTHPLHQANHHRRRTQRYHTFSAPTSEAQFHVACSPFTPTYLPT